MNYDFIILVLRYKLITSPFYIGMEAVQNPSDQEFGQGHFQGWHPPHTSNRPQHASSLKAIEKLKDNSAYP
jgi:hypothetical protein